MLLRRSLVLALFAAAFASSTKAEDKPAVADGNWYLQYRPLLQQESRLAIFKTETKDGKTTMKTVASGQQEWSTANVKVEGKNISFDVTGPVTLKFEGIIDAKDNKIIRGSLGDANRLFQASLVNTDAEKLEGGDAQVKVKLPEAFTEINKARTEIIKLQNQVRMEKDADKKKELQDELKKAQSSFEEKTAEVLKKVADEEKDTPAGFFVRMDLINGAAKSKAKLEDVKAYTETALAYAAKHGPKFEQDAAAKISATLSSQAAYAKIAVELADKALANAKDAPAAVKLRLMKSLATAQETAGMSAEAKANFAKIEKLEDEADAEYKKTVPPFTPKKYEGRKKEGANKVAVLELFTGAQCPPCVSADVAFDALGKAYAPKDLVLLQYHMHIPGPDPLTNADSEGRWKFYSELFEGKVRGTPTAMFNGKIEAPLGGGMKDSEDRFNTCTKLIDDILEQTSPYTLTGKATLTGDKLTANIKVEAKEKPDGDQMLRVLLVEEEVRYLGGNGLRLHHHVVRSQFGLKEGQAVKKLKDGTLEVTLNLADLKKDLKKYLDDYAANRPFPNPDRPLNLKKLKVVALVQDDLNGTISQAVQLDVGNVSE